MAVLIMNLRGRRRKIAAIAAKLIVLANCTERLMPVVFLFYSTPFIFLVCEAKSQVSNILQISPNDINTDSHMVYICLRP
jgi:hypothetical protein